jgi:hypothetical protein
LRLSVGKGLGTTSTHLCSAGRLTSSFLNFAGRSWHRVGMCRSPMINTRTMLERKRWPWWCVAGWIRLSSAPLGVLDVLASFDWIPRCSCRGGGGWLKSFASCREVVGKQHYPTSATYHLLPHPSRGPLSSSSQRRRLRFHHGGNGNATYPESECVGRTRFAMSVLITYPRRNL